MIEVSLKPTTPHQLSLVTSSLPSKSEGIEDKPFNPTTANSKEQPKKKRFSLPSELILIPCALVSGVRYTGNLVKSILGLQTNGRILGTLKVVSILSIPFAIFTIGKNVADFTKGTINEKVDSALNLADNVGNVGDNVASGIMGLQSAGIVITKASMWLTPLFVVSLALELSGLVLTVKSLAENILFYRQISQPMTDTSHENSLKIYERNVDYLLKKQVGEKSVIGKHLNVKGKKLFNRLLDIELEATAKIQSINETVINEGKALLSNTLTALKNRITMKMISNVIIIAAAVATIAGSILLFTPAQPAGFALLALGLAVGLSQLAFEYETTRRFENTLQLNGVGVHRNFLGLPSWITDWPKKRKRIHRIENSSENIKLNQTQLFGSNPALVGG